MTMFTEKSGAVSADNTPAQRSATAESDNGTFWAMTGLGSMTILGTLALITPYLLSGFRAGVVSFLIAALMFGAA